MPQFSGLQMPSKSCQRMRQAASRLHLFLLSLNIEVFRSAIELNAFFRLSDECCYANRAKKEGVAFFLPFLTVPGEMWSRTLRVKLGEIRSQLNQLITGTLRKHRTGGPIVSRLPSTPKLCLMVGGKKANSTFQSGSDRDGCGGRGLEKVGNQN